MQTAFQILVASSLNLLQENDGDLWNSGLVQSGQSLQIAYKGKRLRSRMRCYWKVRIWDEARRTSPWSDHAAWTMGLLKPSDWIARWIGRDEDSGQVFAHSNWIWYPEGNPSLSAPVATRYFRRFVTLSAAQKVTQAWFALAIDDQYELWMNGRRVGTGDNWMKPGNLNVAKYLHPGRNTVEIKATNVGDAPNPAGVIAQLHVEFAKGAAIDVVSDKRWEASTDSISWTKSKELAKFGGGPWNPEALNHGPLPARYLRREFYVAKRVAHATAYVCGLGFFDLFLNGAKVSDHVMDPVLSDYSKTDYYVTFDVTEQLRSGRNAVGVILGNGRFYAPRLAVPIASSTFGFPKLLFQLEIEYRDGAKETVVSDANWQMTTHGPIRANNEYDGEEYDARLEMPGWDRPFFPTGANWRAAQVVVAPSKVMRAQMIEPMRVTQVVQPISVIPTGTGSYLVDMGQNFYGTVRFKASGMRGRQMRMVCAYNVTPSGGLKTADNRSALSTDRYTFKGAGVEVWSPRFRGQGYRRIQVIGFPGQPTKDDFEGLVIHTDVHPAGDFQCSNDLINRIHSAIRWGMRSFLRSAPLDPDRDERQAWTGDPAKDAESEAFNFDVSSFYRKWMDDIETSQRADGSLPDVAMYWNMGAGVEWPSVFTVIPDWMSNFYSDLRVGQSHFDAMKTWVRAMRRYELPDGTLSATSYGDWCDASTIDGKAADNGATPRELISTAYQYNNCRIVARLAKLGNRTSEEREFSEWADKLKAAFNRKFFDKLRGTYLGETQCGYVLALKFGLAPDESRDTLVAHLVDDVMVKHGGHLTVGLIGMQWLMQTLTEVGHPEVAWTIATQTTRPSWGYMLSKGATTIWERWDYDTRDPGMNSEDLLIQAGNLDAWFYQTLAGINYDPVLGGFKHIMIKPQVLGNLTWVKAHFDSPYGRILSAWKLLGKRMTLDVTIPANTTATVIVPGKDGGRHEVGSGEHLFVSNQP
jgi:alpha-L-rhamnosidase